MDDLVALRGTRLNDYRVAGEVARRDVGGGKKAIMHSAVQGNRNVMLTVLYDEGEPATLGMGEAIAAEYSFASGTRVPKHPSVLQALHTFIDSAGQTIQSPRYISEWERAIFVVTPPAGRPLSALITERNAPFPAHQVLTLAAQIISALAHIQHHGVAHRAVSCDTIYIDDNWNAKMTGFANAFDARSAASEGGWKMLYLSKYTRRGDEAVLPPDLLRTEPGRGVTLDYEHCDAYGAGLVLHRLLTGHPYPYQHGAQYATEASYISITGVDAELADLVYNLLRTNADQRISLPQAHHTVSTLMARSYYVEACRAQRFSSLASQAVEITARAEEAEADKKAAMKQKAALEEELADAQWKLGDLDMMTKELEAMQTASEASQAKIVELEGMVMALTTQLMEEKQTREALDVMSKTQAAQLTDLEQKLHTQEVTSTDRIATLTGLLDNTKIESISRLAEVRARNEEIVTAVKLNKKEITPDAPIGGKPNGKQKKLRKTKGTPRSSSDEETHKEPPSTSAPPAKKLVASSSDESAVVQAAPAEVPKEAPKPLSSSDESERQAPKPAAKPAQATFLGASSSDESAAPPKASPPKVAPKAVKKTFESSSSDESAAPALKPPTKPAAKPAVAFMGSSSDESAAPPKPAPKAPAKPVRNAFESSSSDESAVPAKPPAKASRARAASMSSDSDDKPDAGEDVGVEDDPFAALAVTAPEPEEEKPAAPVYDSSSEEEVAKPAPKPTPKKPATDRARAFSRYSAGDENENANQSGDKAGESSDSDFIPAQAARQMPTGRRPTQNVHDTDSESSGPEHAVVTKVLKRAPGERLGLGITSMEVTSIAAGTPAERCCLVDVVGMMLTHIDGKPVASGDDVRMATEGKTEFKLTFREKTARDGELSGDESESESDAPAPVKPAPRARGKSILAESSSDSSDGMFASRPAPKVSPKVTERVRGRSIHMGSSDESSDDVPVRPMARGTSASPTTRTRGKSFLSSSSSSGGMPTKPKPPSKTAKPRTKSFISSDSDSDSSLHVKPAAKKAPAKRALTTISDSDSSDGMLVPKKPAKVVPKASKPRSKSMFESSDDSESEPRPKPAAKRTVAARKVPASSLFPDSSSSD